jgi:prepilin-type N-terminal cleavage/methylation domain-containing protein/prepilin-type processing-associated H-X9-DG protein
MFQMQKRNAFTLIELLVVIGIISVLIAILLPALNGARRSEMTIQCASNTRQIGMAFVEYAQDNNGYICPADLPWSYNTSNPTRWTVEMVLGKYLIDQGLIYNVAGNSGNTLYSSNGMYDGMNVLYLDGHVDLETLEDVYYASRATSAPWAPWYNGPPGSP